MKLKEKRSFTFIFIFIIIILLDCSSGTQIRKTSYKTPIAEIYKGNIEEAAEFIAKFPTEDEAEQILNELNSISEEIRAMLYGEIPPNPAKIDQIRKYVFELFRKTEILQWYLFQFYENQTISLLPGEGITLTLQSYCLDHSAASPALDEFYYIDEIPDKQAEWLTPLINYVSKHLDKDLPVQGLIWNMNQEVSYYDLPHDQQELLRMAVPDAEKRYIKEKLKKDMKEKAKEFFKPILEKIKEKVEPITEKLEVIDNIFDLVSQLEERKSKLKLIHPQYDTYQLDNGLLIQAKSTGHYSSLILTIVNPKSNKLGYKSYPFENLNFAFIGNNFTEKWTKKLRKLKDFSEKCLDAKDKLEEIDDFIEDPDGYIKGRGFNKGLDFFKTFQLINPKAKEAFESFRKSNLELLDAQKNKLDRPKKRKLKPYKPCKTKFKPGRDDVQPLKPVFGCG